MTTLHTISERFPFEPFNEEKHVFNKWAKELRSFMSEVEEEISRSDGVRVLLHFLPEEIRSEAIAKANKPLTFETLVDAVEGLNKPVMRLSDFYREEQSNEESGAEFALRMKKLGNKLGVEKQELIRQIKNGLYWKIKDKVIGSYFPNYEELEATIADCEKSLKSNGNTGTLNSQRSDRCANCGRVGHKAEACRSATKCFACGQFGHRSDTCNRNAKSEERGDKSAKEVKLISKDVMERQEMKVDKFTEIVVNGIAKQCLIDTGADISCVGINVIEELKVEMIPCNEIVRGIDGFVKIIGKCVLQFKFGENDLKHTFCVLECHHDLVLGRDILGDVLDCYLVWKKTDKQEINLLEEESMIKLGKYKDNYSYDRLKPAYFPPVVVKLKEGYDLEKLKQKPYLHYNREIMDELTRSLEERNILVRECSPIASPAFTVPKPFGKWRFVVDLRKLNSMTVPCGYPIPLIRDIMQLFLGSCYYSKIDWTDAFFACLLAEDCRWLFGITTTGGQFVSQRMLMGGRTSMGEFQQRVDTAFESLDGKVSFVDDLVLHTRTLEEHERLLDRYFEIASSLNLPINWDKTHLFLTEVNFCGFTVNSEGYRCRDGYIVQLKGIKPPATKQQCQKVLGMFNWVRDFIPHFDLVMAPIRKCVATSPFKWTSAAQESFTDAIRILEVTELIFFNGGPYDVFTDASALAIGGTVYSNDKICGLFSQALSPTERYYCTFEKEMLAIEKLFLRFGKFFVHNVVRVHCDNEAAGHFLKGYGKKITPKVQSWIDVVQQYNVEYVPTSGKENHQADYLSRLPHEVKVIIKKSKTDNGQITTKQTTEEDQLEHKSVIIDEEYVGDDVIACRCGRNVEFGVMFQCDICDRYVHSECYQLDVEEAENDFVCDACIGRQDIEQIPTQELELGDPPTKEEIKRLLAHVHRFHAGIVAMRIILKGIKWQNKDKDIVDFVRGCPMCVQKSKPRHTKMSFCVPERINQYVGIDLMEVTFEEEDYKYVAVIRDMYSGMLHVKALIGKNAKETLDAFIEYCSQMGMPETIVHDVGAEYLSDFKGFVKREHIKEEISTPEVKHENGLSERAVRYVRQLMRIIRTEYPEADASRQMALVKLYANYTPRGMTGYSPIELVTLVGSDYTNQKVDLQMMIREEVAAKIEQTKSRELQERNKGLRNAEFTIGDRVWYFPINKAKKTITQIAYCGEIVNKIRDKQFVVKLVDDPDKQHVAHSDQLVYIEDEILGDCSVEELSVKVFESNHQYGIGEVDKTCKDWAMHVVSRF